MQTETRPRKDDNDTTTPRTARARSPSANVSNVRMHEAGEGQGFGFEAQAWGGQPWGGGPPAFQAQGQIYGQQAYPQPYGPQPGFGQAQPQMAFPNPFASVAPTLSYGLAGVADLLYRSVALATAQGQALLGALQPPVAGRQQQPPQVAWPNARLPPVDIVDEGAELVCQVELPGTKPESVDVACHGRGILVTAHAEPDIDLGALVQAERGLQVTYRRAIQLPALVNPSGAKARLRDGILTINVPKADPTEGPRRVPVE